MTMMDFTADIRVFLEKRSYSRFIPTAALIDMDGVLYDSMPMHARAWLKMAQANGLSAELDEFFEYEGMTGAATLNVLFERCRGRKVTPEEVEVLYAQKSANFKAQGDAPMMRGASRMLQELKNHGLDCVLVTGSGQRSLIDRVEADYPGIFCGRIITSADVTKGKPDPEPYLKGMKLVGAKADECLVIENAPLGVVAGAKSGAFTVGIATGPIPEEKLRNAGADVTFGSMTAFADALPILLKQFCNVEI